MATDSTPDTGYKLIFSHAVVVEDLLRGFVSGCRVRSTTACAGRWSYGSTGSYFAG